jgi:hypothetical protein
MPKLTPTESRLYARMRQSPASAEELLSLLADEMATMNNLQVHLHRMRKKGVEIHRHYHIFCTDRLDNPSTVPYNIE